MPLVHVVGARPNFVKAAPVITALVERGAHQLVVHTGQHHDDELSGIFFRDLGMAAPDVSLEVGSGNPAQQLARLLVRLDDCLGQLSPSLVIVYGDVNSTLAAALAAARLGLPVCHVEAGLRSFDMSMPEELNRRVADLVSRLLMVTSPEAVDNLAAEGIDPSRVHLVGNPMIDSLLANLDRLDPAAVGRRYGIAERYAVATLHRPANVDRAADAGPIVAALADVAGESGPGIQIVLPLHPRGREMLTAAGLDRVANVTVLPPLGYIDFLSLMRGAALVITDSGGLQEETTVLGVPCLTLRPNTERPITISHGTNRLISVADLRDAVAGILALPPQPLGEPPPLWDGRAGERIAAIVYDWMAGPGA